MTLFHRMVQGIRAFWCTVTQPQESVIVPPQFERVDTHRVEEPLLADPFGPLNQRESHTIVVPLFDGDIEFATSSKHVQQCDGELAVTSQVRSVYRAEDGTPLTDVGQLYQCASCHSTVSPESLFVCSRCQLRFCRGPGCRNEVEGNGIRLDVCQSCKKQYYQTPLYSSPLGRKLFDY